MNMKGCKRDRNSVPIRFSIYHMMTVIIFQVVWDVKCYFIFIPDYMNQPRPSHQVMLLFLNVFLLSPPLGLTLPVSVYQIYDLLKK